MRLGNLEPGEIESLIQAETVAHLGCVRDGEAYVVPVNYAREPGRDAIVLHSLEGAKLSAMRAHPHVCLEIEHIDGLTNWKTVVVEGQFEELRGDEARAALRLLIQRLLPPEAQIPEGVDPFCPPGAGTAVLCRIRLTDKAGRFASD